MGNEVVGSITDTLANLQSSLNPGHRGIMTDYGKNWTYKDAVGDFHISAYQRYYDVSETAWVYPAQDFGIITLHDTPAVSSANNVLMLNGGVVSYILLTDLQLTQIRNGANTMSISSGGDVTLTGKNIKVNGSQQISFSKTLTDGSPTGVFEVEVLSEGMIGGTLHYSIYATDGTDMQAHTGQINFAAINKAGTVTSDLNEAYLTSYDTNIVSAGTLSDTWAVTNGTNKITVTLNANSSLTTTSVSVRGTLILHGSSTVTLL